MDNNIIKDFKAGYPKWVLQRISERDGEGLFGTILGLLKDEYNLPKTCGFEYALALEEYYNSINV